MEPTFVTDFQESLAPAFPAFSGVRVMMMPFHVYDAQRTLPRELQTYAPIVDQLAAQGCLAEGVGYLTIDEAHVSAGAHHRRPGRHVDGVDERYAVGAWGPGQWGAGGMVIAASHVGCQAWRGEARGHVGANGDCAAVDAPGAPILMVPGRAYTFSGMTLHESLPLARDARRQFIRVSGPSDGAWYEGYTPNPLGIAPTGEIRARREFMDYRP